MACFVSTRHPSTGLALDGLLWGGAVGALISFLFFPIGLVVGGGAGLVIGLVAGLAFLVGSWMGCPVAALAVGVITSTLWLTYLVVYGLFPADSGSVVNPFAAFVVGLAAVPLGVDVVMRTRGHFRKER